MKNYISKLTAALSPAQLKARAGVKQVVVSFAETWGFVYFGSMSQHDEDAHVVRGVTLSVDHQDSHICVGSNGGYDIAFTERRNQLIVTPGNYCTSHTWHIMEFDLHTTKDLPHTFISFHDKNESIFRQLFTKFPALRPIKMGALHPYPPQFISNYLIYTRPSNAILVERILSPETADMIAKHFGTLSIEITKNALYIYSEHAKLSAQLLETLLKNGVWLAAQIDKSAKEL